MTAYPNPTEFVTHTTAPAAVHMRPSVTEHYWGYEVAANEQVIDIAVLMRAACGVFTVAAFLAAFGVWFLPAIVFAASPFAAKAAVSVCLLVLGVFLARIAARGTRVRVQVDTANGELREVVDGPFGAVIVLAQYGLDAVEAIDIVRSKANPSFGQIQITIKGVGPLPVGDGAIVTLLALLERVAGDCGVTAEADVRPAVWTGPLAA